MNELMTFTLIALLLVVSPGPNGVLILKTVSAHNKKSGIMNILGLTSATFVHGALSIFGLSALLLQSSNLFILIKIIGASYLFYIGAKAIWLSFQIDKRIKTHAQPQRILKNRSYFYFFSEGFLTQLLNPKVSMFYLAAFPQFISFDPPSYRDAFTLVTIHASIIFFWFLGVTQLVGRLKQLSQQSSLGLWVQRVSGVVLVYFSGLLLSQEANGK
jgi:threonine/homoserine/homoserine lactone efflux protein